MHKLSCTNAHEILNKVLGNQLGFDFTQKKKKKKKDC